MNPSPSRSRPEDRLLFEQSTLLELMAQLTAERDPDRLLARILLSMRQLVGAEAGSLYVVDEVARCLRFRVAQNDRLGLSAVPTGALPLERSSVVGQVVLGGQPLNLPDVRRAPEGIVFNDAFDRSAGYRTVSMLTVPLTDAEGKVLGAVQLINRLEGGRVVAFDQREAQLATQMAGAAGIALVNARLASEIAELFDGFVRASVLAIEARDPTTSGHSIRVSALAVGLADAAGRRGGFAELPLPPNDRRTLKYAALLHDFGKIGVREDVLVKARKLHPWEIEGLRQRFEIIGLTEEVRLLRTALHAGTDPAVVETAIAAFRAELDHSLETLIRGADPTPATPELQALVASLGGQLWTDRHGAPHPWLSQREQECLGLPYGSLTEGEREDIQDHAAFTERFLAAMPWGEELAGLPEIAAAHHEKIDGSGYPLGLRGAQVPLPSQMITVVDIYDALTALDRPYRKAIPHARACDILWSEADKGRLDERLVRAFVDEDVVGLLG